ncbi:alpha/beta hydrolase [Kribbella italica]|uniref:alpha/beta hydrolase n=1 Tax=Kribbella italica TaxID=1540520 RepID=UPI00192D9A6A|nr:alpha/beta hydrolase [Kribbella italica]
MILVHGGLWDRTDAAMFWHAPGIVAGLEAVGLDVVAPDRVRRPVDWRQEVGELGRLLTSAAEPVTLVGASNGCTVAVLLAADYPEAVGRLLLAWPATGDDPEVSGRARAGLLERGASGAVADGLLAGETLRGVTDAQLVSLGEYRGPWRPGLPIGVLPSVPENPSHQRKTVDALLRLMPSAVELPGSPEPPRPDFGPHRDRLVAVLGAFAGGGQAGR